MHPRIHDLLEIDVQRFLSAQASLPGWVPESLRAAPFVVVRRGTGAAEHEIPVGIRADARNQRWAGLCDVSWIRRIATPAELKNPPGSPRADTIPALRSLARLAGQTRWKALDCPWGPGGSVGFELATGHPTAKPTSDLDVVIYAERRLGLEEAQRLLNEAQGLPSAVDVRVETPLCGFSLAEYARAASPNLLLRLPTGTVLAPDPWATSLVR